MRVLLVEDDAILGDGLRQALGSAGFVVDWLVNGRHADAILREEKYDLLLLDWNLPGMSGLDVLKNLRARETYVPVLLLTARDLIADRVEGLDCGADDYLIKPFEFKELLARMRALGRRFRGRGNQLLQLGSLVLDPLERKCVLDGAEVRLSQMEFRMLYMLMESPGRVVPKHRLEETVYGQEIVAESNTLEVYVHHLRRKLGRRRIRTVRGVGYLIERE
ncbi:MAG: response regulator transcription factor [Magnetococcales bacterium]|nr:response regulator transcription factor [Magnetococcales bacterium]